MKYQDIHRSDAAFWEQYKQYIAAGQYNEAASLIGEVDDKALIAEVFNYMTGQDGDYTKPNLKTLQEHQSSTFKQDRIQLADEPPAGMKTGEVYFQFDRAYYSEFPSKGDLIEIEGKQYRVLNMDGSVATLFTMYDPITWQDYGVSNDYVYSVVARILLNYFNPYLSNAMQAAIIESKIAQYEYTYNTSSYNATTHASYANYSTRTEKQPITVDTYVLGVEDIEEYFGGRFSTSDIKMLFWNTTNVPTDKSSIWLNSAEKDTTNYVWYVNGRYGYIGQTQTREGNLAWIRPAFKINLSKISYTIVK